MCYAGTMNASSERLPTISIGLPALNEEANIKILIEQILRQRIVSGTLIEILVMSDGSTDSTIAQAASVGDPRIKLFDFKERRGKYAIENEIFSHSTGDIMCIFDCDVLLANDSVIEKLIEPIVADRTVGIVGADIYPAEPKNFFESIMAESHKIKTDIYRTINHSDTMYLCHGRGRAFNRALYPTLKWLEGYPEDAFSYFACMEKGFKFVYAPEARVIFRSPTHFKDHVRQDSRYISGKKRMEEYFGREKVKQVYHIPFWSYVWGIGKHMMTSPIRTISYCVMTFYLWFLAPGKKVYKTMWDVSESSKRVQ